MNLVRILLGAAALVLANTTDALACPVCFQAEETPMIDGTKFGILALMVITFAVQGGFVGFFLYLRRRARRVADIELDSEWSELQKGPSRTS